MPRRSPRTQKQVDLTPGRPRLARSGELPRSAAAELGLRRRPAAARVPKPSEPPIQETTAGIRSDPDLIWTVRSKTDNPDSKIPLRRPLFAKESLISLLINPWSSLSQKFLR